MSKQHTQSFYIVGIAIRTTNENQQAAKDIPLLWERFRSEKISEKIPDKTDETIYCVYTDYEKDHTKPYTTVLGCRVNSLKKLSGDLISTTIHTGEYEVFTAKGNLLQGVVYHEWIKIWNADIQRAFTSDFEVYGAKAGDCENAEVDIFVAVK